MKKIKLLFLLLFLWLWINKTFSFDEWEWNTISTWNTNLTQTRNYNERNFTWKNDWSIFYTLEQSWTTSYICQYNLSTNFDFSTATLYICFNPWKNLAYKWLDYDEETHTFYYLYYSGVRKLVKTTFVNDNLDSWNSSTEVNLSWIIVKHLWFSKENNSIITQDTSNNIIQHNITTWSTMNSYSLWIITNSWNFWPEGLKFYYKANNKWTITEKSLSNPYDLSTISWTTWTFTTWQSNYFKFFNTYSKILSYRLDVDSYTSWNVDYYEYDTNYSLWPAELAITSSGTLDIQDQSIILEDFETTEDFYMSYVISDLTNNEEFYFINNDETVFSWSILNDLSFSDVWLAYNPLVDYEIEVILTSYYDPLDVILYNFTFNYTYNSWYTEPDPLTFSFITSWITFIENWFILNNFIPDPYWWSLYFEIIAPSLTWTWTVELTTNNFYNLEVDWKGYGVDTGVRVTYPYHQIAWDYQVRVLYEYDNVIVYPFWEDYNSYTITLPESPETDFEIEVIETNFFRDIKYFFIWIRDLFKELMKIWNVEPKNFGFNFIQKANASSTDVLYIEMDMTQNNILTQFYWYIKWFIMFALLIILITILIIILRKE